MFFMLDGVKGCELLKWQHKSKGAGTVQGFLLRREALRGRGWQKDGGKKMRKGKRDHKGTK